MKTDERNEEQGKKCNSSFSVTKGGMKHLNVRGVEFGGRDVASGWTGGRFCFADL